jgi:hypothetical protein
VASKLNSCGVCRWQISGPDFILLQPTADTTVTALRKGVLQSNVVSQCKGQVCEACHIHENNRHGATGGDVIIAPVWCVSTELREGGEGKIQRVKRRFCERSVFKTLVLN